MQFSVIQPNVDAYEKFQNSDQMQERNIVDLLGEVPSSSQVAVLPETAIPSRYLRSTFANSLYVRSLSNLLSENLPNTTIVTGCKTVVLHESKELSLTGRKLSGSDLYVDYFNSVAAH